MTQTKTAADRGSIPLASTILFFIKLSSLQYNTNKEWGGITQGSTEMIYDPDQGIRVSQGNIWSLAGENPATPQNEVTPLLTGGTGNSQLGGLVA